MLVMMSGTAAFADGEKAGMLKIPARTLKVGAEAAIGSATGRGTSLMFGAAATYTHINHDLIWYGIQADVLADWNGDLLLPSERSSPVALSPRWTVGPQLGIAIIGGDVSYYGQAFDGVVFHGAAVRLKLTIGVAALYVRYGYLPEADHHSFDFGAQLKFPIYASEEQIDQ